MSDSIDKAMEDLLNWKKSDNGLLPVVAQDVETGEVLMLAYMNKEAWVRTRTTRRATYFSRSRGTLWVKGETSGNIQEVEEIRIDCDQDTVLLKVRQTGPACHEGTHSCFSRCLLRSAKGGG